MANLIRLKQIESASYLEAAGAIGQDFSQSVVNTVIDNVGVILDGETIRDLTLVNTTITTDTADKYSLVVSGAIVVVDATNLSGSSDGDIDTVVPGQIYLVSGSVPPTDPYVSGSEQSNIIDQGEW